MTEEYYTKLKAHSERCRKGIAFQRAKYLRQSLMGESAQKLDNTKHWLSYHEKGLQNSLAILTKHQQDHTLSGSKSK